MIRHLRYLAIKYYRLSRYYFKILKDYASANKINIFIGIAGVLIAMLELHQSYQQSEMESLQRSIEQSQKKILSAQTSLDTTQTSINALDFVREYINGYVYQYGQIKPSDVDSVVKDIRSVGLPAIAVPSQYSIERWVVMTHSMGDFSDIEEAESLIMSWRNRLEGFEEDDKSKTRIFKRYEEHLIEDLNSSGFVFRYKADILNHKEYFIKLARSEDFYIDVEDYTRKSKILRFPSEGSDS